jgi:glycerophosphoryl diester phosphodiesterase
MEPPMPLAIPDNPVASCPPLKGCLMTLPFASFYISVTGISQNISYSLQEKSTLQISAHRGNASSAPENTLAAFKNALQAGAHFIEVDVRTTNDSVLMIMHDANLERTTNGKGAFKLYDAKYLKTLSAGKGYSDSFENEKIPTLEESCQLIYEWNLTHKAKTFFYIDAKDVEPKPLISMLRKYNLEANSVFYGSDDFLHRLKMEFEGAKLLPALKNPTEIIEKFNKLKPFAFDASWLSLTKEMVDEIHRLGVKVFTDLLGPLDTEINYMKARDMGLDLIQTDRILAVQKIVKN